MGWGGGWGGVELVIVSICVTTETSSFFRVFSSWRNAGKVCINWKNSSFSSVSSGVGWRMGRKSVGS